MRVTLLSIASMAVLVTLLTLAQLATRPAAALADAKAPALPLSAPPPDDAAAKHAKRTACLKDAKAKKLVGDQKAAFLKQCFAAP